MVHCTDAPSKNSALQCGTRSDAGDAFCIERQHESCSAIAALNLASLDALWLLLPTGGRRCSASAVRFSASREPGQRGHEVLGPRISAILSHSQKIIHSLPPPCRGCEVFINGHRRICASAGKILSQENSRSFEICYSLLEYSVPLRILRGPIVLYIFTRGPSVHPCVLAPLPAHTTHLTVW